MDSKATKSFYKKRFAFTLIGVTLLFLCSCKIHSVTAVEFSGREDCTIETEAKIVARVNALRNLAHSIYFSRLDIKETGPDETIVSLPEVYLVGAQEIGCDQFEDGRIEVTMAVEHEGRTIMAKGNGYPSRFLAPKKHFPPDVFILTPAPMLSEFSTGEDSILVRAVAKAKNNEPITDIYISHDGNRVEDVRYRDIDIVKRKKTEKRGKKLEEFIEATIPLHEGVNIIEVTAYNNFKKSDPKTIRVNMIPETHESNLYVLSIGISEYEKGEIYNLDYAHEDAIGIIDSINEKNCKNYKSVTKKLLIDDKAKRSDILDGLDWLAKRVHLKKDDTVVIYISGHGLKDIIEKDKDEKSEIYYFLPYDGDHEKLRQTAVNWHQFIDLLSHLPSKTVLFVDTCHAGSIVGQQALAGSVGNATVIAASISDKRIIEFKDFGHSALGQAMIEGLEGKADLLDNGKGNINLNELSTYISYRVEKITEGCQKTTYYSPGASVDYCLFETKN